MDLKQLFGEEWYKALNHVFQTPYWKRIGQEIAKERNIYTVYPEKGSDTLFKAFRTTPLSKVKVVILGQDPYHDGSYDGFAFSNRESLRISPSLKNILKEVEDDIHNGFQLNQSPELERWAEQGVLLINTAHTVRKGDPGSHLEYWKEFTSEVILQLLQQDRPIVWMLWGKKAENAILSMNEKHLALYSPHPSPFSVHTGFFGNKHFSQANKFLEDEQQRSISW